MIKNVLTHIGGIENYGVISVCLFFAVFTGTLVWALRVRQSVADQMSALPLDDGAPDPYTTGDTRHE